MTLEQQIDDYLSVYGIHKDLSTRAKEADKNRKVSQYKLVDAMIEAQNKLYKCEDDVSVCLINKPNIAVNEGNTQEIREWLMATTGDDSQFIVEKINKTALTEWLVKEITDGKLAVEDLPGFLDYKTYSGVRVNGWEKRRR